MIINNVIIIGITGVGKSTIGKYLAEYLNKQFIDLDKLIEHNCGVDIPTIFELEGERGFRLREIEALQHVVTQMDNYVLALGGGSVIALENRKLIERSSSLVVQLVADLSIIVERLIKSPNRRPLLTNTDIKSKIEELYLKRKAWYELVSDVTINTTQLKPHQIIEQIAELLPKSRQL